MQQTITKWIARVKRLLANMGEVAEADPAGLSFGNQLVRMTYGETRGGCRSWSQDAKRLGDMSADLGCAIAECDPAGLALIALHDACAFAQDRGGTWSQVKTPKAAER